MDDVNRLFAGGRGNPAKFGRPIRFSAGEEPDLQQLEDAVRSLGRPVFFVDADGYEREIIGAALNASGDIAYVESRAKDVGGHVDISIRVHLVKSGGRHESVDIESYNPYFGCDVRFFDWIDTSAILIYREKHWTFACRFGDIWPPKFVKIEDDWAIDKSILNYIGYKETMIRRVNLPGLDVLDPIPASEAAKTGLAPVIVETYNRTPPIGIKRKRSWLERLFGRSARR
jgi:hypothetical protein